MGTGHWHDNQFHKWHWSDSHWIRQVVVDGEVQTFELNVYKTTELEVEGFLKTVNFDLELDKNPTFPLNVHNNEEPAEPLELHKKLELDIELHKQLEVVVER